MTQPRGRPISENPHSKTVIVRLTAADREKLDYIAAKFGIKISDVVRQCIETMYEKAKKEE
ncbi:MAG: CopG family transcriptional regulator [Lachnospiraceae bacterium]|nr:CopG family transcriptional regulator [Lachnospiraceae bacterium]